MGNTFERECSQLIQVRSELQTPQFLDELINSQFRSPFALFKTLKVIAEKHLVVSYLLKKKPFLHMVHETFNLDPHDHGKRLYKLFKVKNAKGSKVVNVLEVLCVIILLTNFSNFTENGEDEPNSELIEHKINLMLILFDLREEQKMNVVEVMLMVRTILQAFSKVFPNIEFFRNVSIFDEIKPAIMELFQGKLEQKILEEQELEKVA